MVEPSCKLSESDKSKLRVPSKRSSNSLYFIICNSSLWIDSISCLLISFSSSLLNAISDYFLSLKFLLFWLCSSFLSSLLRVECVEPRRDMLSDFSILSHNFLLHFLNYCLLFLLQLAYKIDSWNLPII